MSARARVEYDLMGGGVRLAAALDKDTIVIWPDGGHLTVKRTEGPAVVVEDDAWLHLPEDIARAVYEALGEFFGGTANDVRTLRKDYDAERARVDKFITHLTTGARA